MQSTSNALLPASLQEAIAYVLAQGSMRVKDTPPELMSFDNTSSSTFCKLFRVPQTPLERSFATSWVTGFRCFLAGRGIVPSTMEGWRGFTISPDLSRELVRVHLAQFLDTPIADRDAEIEPIKVEVEKALAARPEGEQFSTSEGDPFDILDYTIADVLAFLAGRREGPGYHPCETGDPALFGMGPLQSTYNAAKGAWDRNPDAEGDWDLTAARNPPDDLAPALKALGVLAAMTGALEAPDGSNERIVDVLKFLALILPIGTLRDVVKSKEGEPWGPEQKALALATLDALEVKSGAEPAVCGADTGAQPDLDDDYAARSLDDDTELDS